MKTFRPINPSARKVKNSEALASVKRQERELETEMKMLEARILEAPLIVRERRAVRLDTVPPMDDLTHAARPFGLREPRQMQARMRSETISNFLGFLLMLALVMGLGCWLWKLLLGAGL